MASLIAPESPEAASISCTSARVRSCPVITSANGCPKGVDPAVFTVPLLTGSPTEGHSTGPVCRDPLTMLRSKEK